MAFFLLSLHNQLEAEMMRQMVFELARKQVHWYIPQPAFCYSGNLARKRVPREMQSKMPPPHLMAWVGTQNHNIVFPGNPCGGPSLLALIIIITNHRHQSSPSS